MIRMFLLLALIISFNGILFSQSLEIEKPNYKKIQKNIQKEKSYLYYPKLMERFLSGDSLFTLQEKRHLYYGYTFHDNYSPYSHSSLFDSLGVYASKETLDSVEYYEVIQLCDSILTQKPFELRAINFQLYALEQTKQYEEFNKRLSQMRLIFDALLSSGDGLSKKTAFYVIYTSHEYDLLGYLGLGFGGQQSLTDHYDYLNLAENKQNIKGLYFDVSPCLNYLSNRFN